MNDFTDKVKGTANEVVGKAKVAVGKGIDSPKLVVEGTAQEIKGKAEKVVGEVKSEINKNK